MNVAGRILKDKNPELNTYYPELSDETVNAIRTFWTCGYPMKFIRDTLEYEAGLEFSRMLADCGCGYEHEIEDEEYSEYAR